MIIQKIIDIFALKPLQDEGGFFKQSYRSSDVLPTAALVPRGCRQAVFLNDGGSFALMGATMRPGFDYDDYKAGDRKILITQRPERKGLIEKLLGKTDF